MHLLWTKTAAALSLALGHLYGRGPGREQALLELPLDYQHHLNAVTAAPADPIRMWHMINFVEHTCALHHTTASCEMREALESAVMDFMTSAAMGTRPPLHERLAQLPDARVLGGAEPESWAA